MNEELKLCPFCGREMFVAEGTPFLRYMKCQTKGCFLFDVWLKVEKSWNTRHPDKELVEFCRKVISTVCWDHDNMDGCDIQCLAEKLGLVEQRVATKDDVSDWSDFEIGDIIYKFTDILKENNNA